ncbi:MAG: LCP family protein [Anaerovoracaceae bacterium]
MDLKKAGKHRKKRGSILDGFRHEDQQDYDGRYENDAASGGNVTHRHTQEDEDFEKFIRDQYIDTSGQSGGYDSAGSGYDSGYDYGYSTQNGGYGYQDGGGRHGAGRNGRRSRRSSGRRSPGRIIRNVILILLLIFVLITVYIYNATSGFKRQDTSSADFAIDTGASLKLTKYRNIAILGSDARKGEGYSGSRTDAIIILSINRLTGDIKIISVMRDSYLKTGYNDGSLVLDKVTNTFAYGGGAYTCAALNRNLDLNIREFVVFNWKAVADTVDTLGGIEVNIKKNEIRDLNHYGRETARNVGGKYHRITSTGKQTIDGVQAATYCRIRKTSGGDTGRARRYKAVMNAVIKKAVTSPGKIGALRKKVFPEVLTNMSQGQMTTAIMRAPFYHIKGNISWPRKYYGGMVRGVWYAVPTTLARNVRWLHKKAFGQENYDPSDTCRSISSEIISDTGVS